MRHLQAGLCVAANRQEVGSHYLLSQAPYGVKSLVQRDVPYEGSIIPIRY